MLIKIELVNKTKFFQNSNSVCSVDQKKKSNCILVFSVCPKSLDIVFFGKLFLNPQLPRTQTETDPKEKLPQVSIKHILSEVTQSQLSY